MYLYRRITTLPSPGRLPRPRNPPVVLIVSSSHHFRTPTPTSIFSPVTRAVVLLSDWLLEFYLVSTLSLSSSRLTLDCCSLTTLGFISLTLFLDLDDMCFEIHSRLSLAIVLHFLTSIVKREHLQSCVI